MRTEISSSADARKPKLTYSSVIHSLVEQLTRRSPYLQQTGAASCSDDAEVPDQSIALLNRNEIEIGALLGQGNFSNVFEVIGFQLEHEIATRAPKTTEDEGSSQITEGSQIVSPGNETKDDVSIVQRRRLELAANVKSDNGKCMHAIKCLKPELLENPNPHKFLEAATDLVIEAKYLSKLNHGNILKIRGLARGWEAAFADGEYDSFFILTDRLEETINQRIKRWKHGEFPNENTILEKLKLAVQIASALSYLHERRLVFRDLKPQNLGLIRDSSGDSSSLVVKLFDFGFCRELPVADQTRNDIESTGGSSRVSTLSSGESVFLMSGKGTRRYMAPEVLRHNRYNLKADVYSWSMVCWELLTLHKPFYKYTKEQHTIFVCEGGDRPPLESSLTSLWPPSSFHSPSASLSSIQSLVSPIGEESIDFQRVMTDPLRDLLTQAWQDVSTRLTIQEVHHTLQDIIQSLNGKVRDAPATSTSDISSTANDGHYSCLAVRDLVMEIAQDLPIMSCFGREGPKQKANTDPMEQTTESKVEETEDPKCQREQEDSNSEGSHVENRVFSHAFPQFPKFPALMAQ